MVMHFNIISIHSNHNLIVMIKGIISGLMRWELVRFALGTCVCPISSHWLRRSFAFQIACLGQYWIGQQWQICVRRIPKRTRCVRRWVGDQGKSQNIKKTDDLKWLKVVDEMRIMISSILCNLAVRKLVQDTSCVRLKIHFNPFNPSQVTLPAR